jgi:DnaK suppressor protein
MDASLFDQYKQLLLVKRRELSSASLGTFSDAGGLEERAGDPVDRATEETETNLHTRLRQSDTHLLRAIEEALARIARGTFGMCDVCERPIAEARLKVVPWTHLCRECKEQRPS